MLKSFHQQQKHCSDLYMSQSQAKSSSRSQSARLKNFFEIFIQSDEIHDIFDMKPLNTMKNLKESPTGEFECFCILLCFQMIDCGQAPKLPFTVADAKVKYHSRLYFLYMCHGCSSINLRSSGEETMVSPAGKWTSFTIGYSDDISPNSSNSCIWKNSSLDTENNVN